MYANRSEPIDIKRVLSDFRTQVIDEDEVQRVDIRRARIFDDTLVLFSRTHFDVHKHLKVNFIGEAAVDNGGLTREFFRLVISEVLQSCLFAGWPANVVPLHNIGDITLNHFYQIGRILTTCIIHGGQAPHCFARGIAEYLIYGQIKSDPCIDDVYDLQVRNSLKKVGFFV